jgi:TRAP-type C4-dicarboxylate transport system permease small subunit
VELIKWVRLQWDRALGALAMVVGIVLLIIGWVQVSSTEFVSQQIPYVVSAGLGGLVALLIGGTLWLSADLHDEWRELHRLDERLAEGDEVVDDLLARMADLEAQLPRADAKAIPARRTLAAGGRARSAG